jgi:hypothetical protein
MRRSEPSAEARDPAELPRARADLQARLATADLTLEAFSRAWRRLERPTTTAAILPDELRLRRARELLGEFGTLWRDPAVPDRLREEALHEILLRVDVRGPHLVNIHPQPNENAWLLGHAAMKKETMWEWSGREV